MEQEVETSIASRRRRRPIIFNFSFCSEKHAHSWLKIDMFCNKKDSKHTHIHTHRKGKGSCIITHNNNHKKRITNPAAHPAATTSTHNVQKKREIIVD